MAPGQPTGWYRCSSNCGSCAPMGATHVHSGRSTGQSQLRQGGERDPIKTTGALSYPGGFPGRALHPARATNPDSGWQVLTVRSTRIPSLGECTTMTSAAVGTEPGAGGAPRDGQRDFDFVIGRWKFHLRKLRNPLTGSNEWVEYEGESEARPSAAGGRTSTSSGSRRGWHVTRASRCASTTPRPASGASTGRTRRRARWASRRRSAFDEWPGRVLRPRGVRRQADPRPLRLDGPQPTSAHFEQSFSTDEGATWEANWISDQNRIAD